MVMRDLVGNQPVSSRLSSMLHHILLVQFYLIDFLIDKHGLLIKYTF